MIVKSNYKSLKSVLDFLTYPSFQEVKTLFVLPFKNQMDNNTYVFWKIGALKRTDELQIIMQENRELIIQMYK